MCPSRWCPGNMEKKNFNDEKIWLNKKKHDFFTLFFVCDRVFSGFSVCNGPGTPLTGGTNV